MGRLDWRKPGLCLSRPYTEELAVASCQALEEKFVRELQRLERQALASRTLDGARAEDAEDDISLFIGKFPLGAARSGRNKQLNCGGCDHSLLRTAVCSAQFRVRWALVTLVMRTDHIGTFGMQIYKQTALARLR